MGADLHHLLSLPSSGYAQAAQLRRCRSFVNPKTSVIVDAVGRPSSSLADHCLVHMPVMSVAFFHVRSVRSADRLFAGIGSAASSEIGGLQAAEDGGRSDAVFLRFADQPED